MVLSYNVLHLSTSISHQPFMQTLWQHSDFRQYLSPAQPVMLSGKERKKQLTILILMRPLLSGLMTDWS